MILQRITSACAEIATDDDGDDDVDEDADDDAYDVNDGYGDDAADGKGDGDVDYRSTRCRLYVDWPSSRRRPA